MILYEIFKNFIVLLFGHAVADFGLQSEAMAKFKNPNNKSIPPEGQKYVPVWWYWLGSHGLIHGATVYLFTGIFALGLAEVLLHIIIDYMKVNNVTNPHEDQALHIFLKVVYAVMWAMI